MLKKYTIIDIARNEDKDTSSFTVPYGASSMRSQWRQAKETRKRKFENRILKMKRTVAVERCFFV
jgi:hypothetical protein